jgi:hypothetical protein
LCEAHKSAIAGGHGHAADTAAATVAKRKVAPAPSKCWIVAMALAHPSGGSDKQSPAACRICGAALTS